MHPDFATKMQKEKILRDSKCFFATNVLLKVKFPWKRRLWFKNETVTSKYIWQWWQKTFSQGHSESDRCISALVQGAESGDKGRRKAPRGRHCDHANPGCRTICMGMLLLLSKADYEKRPSLAQSGMPLFILHSRVPRESQACWLLPLNTRIITDGTRILSSCFPKAPATSYRPTVWMETM